MQLIQPNLEKDLHILKQLKQDLHQDDIELSKMLSRKHISRFELDRLMNGG